MEHDLAGLDALNGLPTDAAIQALLQAFAAHPRLGDAAALRAKYGAAPAWSEGEQASLKATDDTIAELAAQNAAYEARFGHIFVACAAGRPAADILALMAARLRSHRPHTELAVAAAEQHKITALRLHKLLAQLGGTSPPPAPLSGARRLALVGNHVAPPGARPPARPAAAAYLSGASCLAGSPAPPPVVGRPRITTHVLDTATGRPASGVAIALLRFVFGSNAGACEGTDHPGLPLPDLGPGVWQPIGTGTTDGDGRAGVMAPGAPLDPGTYCMRFGSGGYARAGGFYPQVPVVFEVTPAAAAMGEHFHVPLLLSPYGYATYRGS